MARTRSRYAPDRGLTTRMVSTMFFIGLLYVVLVGVLLAALRGAWPVILVVTGGMFVAQSIKPQARVLATDRGIACALVDYDALRGMDDAEHRLF